MAEFYENMFGDKIEAESNRDSRPTTLSDNLTISNQVKDLRAQIESLQTNSSISSTENSTIYVNNKSHTFVLGDVICFIAGEYKLAIATSEAFADVVGVVSDLVDGIGFGYSPAGSVVTSLSAVKDDSGSMLSDGTIYYLSTITEGAVSTTEPTIETYVSKPIWIALSGSHVITLNTRGIVIEHLVLDEDDMESDSESRMATQQSIKAYVDTEIADISVNADEVVYDNVASGLTATDVQDAIDENNTNINTVSALANGSGFDLLDADSQPDLAWNDGTRTFSCSVKSGQASFHFWTSGIKITKTTTQSVVIPDITGSYYIIFDNDGTLIAVNENALVADNFYEHAIAGLAYWGKTAQLGRAGTELHGKMMDARTHGYNHLTYGARYQDGLNITGLTDGGSTYTSTTSGHFWDEDIQHIVDAQSTHKFLYRLGADGEWTYTTASNEASYNAGGSYDVWNEWTGSTWQLTEGTSSTDYWIVFNIFAPALDSGQRGLKIIGQNAYSRVSLARAAIETELTSLKTNGLPTPEIVFKSAWIVKRDGTAQELADGSMYVNLVDLKGASGGGVAITAHDDLSNINLAQSGQTYGHIDDQAQTIAGIKSFSSFPVTPSSAPTADYEVANKKYVDDNAGGGGDTGYQDILMLGGM